MKGEGKERVANEDGGKKWKRVTEEEGKREERKKRKVWKEWMDGLMAGKELRDD